MVKHDMVYNYSRPGRIRQFSDWLLPIAVFVASFSLYLKTMALSIFWDDSAAFAASNYILGLPHSPSFPLYTLLGRLFNLIPNLTPAYAANLMSALFAAASVTLFYLLMKQFVEVPVIQAASSKRKLGNKTIELGHAVSDAEMRTAEVETISKPAIVILPALMVTFLFAVTLPVWLSAVRAEVYSLHLALTLAAVVVILQAITANKKRLFYLGLWFYALTFANHPLLALAFAPAFAYLIIANFSMLGLRPATIGLVCLFFVASFSVYLYLPFRSALQPAINWGRPDNLDAFVAAITRSSDLSNISQITLAPDYAQRLRQLGQFMQGQIGWPFIGLALLGFIGVYKISRRHFLFFPLAVIGNLAVVLWAADFNPRNFDLINYLAPVTALILIISAAGILYLLRTRVVAAQASIAVAILAAAYFYISWSNNYSRADLSRVEAPDILSHEIVRTVPPGSLLIVAEDDVLLPLWYSAYADSTASGVAVVSAGAMINPKYRQQLFVNFPSLIYPANFNNDQPGKADLLAAALCKLNSSDRAVYVQFGAPGIKAAEVIPAGIIFKYVGNNHPGIQVDTAGYKAHLKFAADLLAGNPSEVRTIDFVGRWLFNAAVYYDRVNRPEIAWKLFNRALDVDKENVDMRIRLASALAKGGKYKEALQYISQALEIDPNNKVSLELGHRIVQAIEKKGPVAVND
ncbi:membrane hypothetical protein [Candidatus Zixiibacteriota bacterium]|nr:membrane hypothetical protein [candidate division Zixibacteria bacterium]